MEDHTLLKDPHDNVQLMADVVVEDFYPFLDLFVLYRILCSLIEYVLGFLHFASGVYRGSFSVNFAFVILEHGGSHRLPRIASTLEL